MNTTVLSSNAKGIHLLKLNTADMIMHIKIKFWAKNRKIKNISQKNIKNNKEDLKNTYNIKNIGVYVFVHYLGNSLIKSQTKNL